MISIFHAQRAVGKAIMAMLVLHGVRLGRTDDLEELGYRAEEAVSDLPFAIDRLIRLNPYAVVFRNGEPAVHLLEPEEGHEVVASVKDWANARIRGMADRERGSGGGPPRPIGLPSDGCTAQVDGMRPGCREPILRRHAGERSFECPQPPVAMVSRGCSSDGEPTHTSDDLVAPRPVPAGTPPRSAQGVAAHRHPAERAALAPERPAPLPRGGPVRHLDAGAGALTRRVTGAPRPPRAARGLSAAHVTAPGLA